LKPFTHRALKLVPPNGRIANHNGNGTAAVAIHRRDLLGGRIHGAPSRATKCTRLVDRTPFLCEGYPLLGRTPLDGWRARADTTLAPRSVGSPTLGVGCQT
jgi:hypothetical protein